MSSEDLPPPAYSEQEFDQKISTALTESLSISQPPARASESIWEEWNEAAFEAAARTIPRDHGPNPVRQNQTAGGGPSQHTGGVNTRVSMPASTEPLRVHKKSAFLGKKSLSKTYFNGYQEDTSNRMIISHSPNMSSQLGIEQSVSTSTLPTTQRISHHAPVEEHDLSMPPPPFSRAEPNPDGTPIVIMTYHPSTSPPSSPPISASLAYSPVPDHRRQLPQVQSQPHHNTFQENLLSHHSSPRRSLPNPVPLQPPNRQPGKRPETSLGPKSMQAPGIPRMDFNPLVAYNKQGTSPLPLSPQQRTQTHTQSFNANAFYNSAVSAHLPYSYAAQDANGHNASQQLPRASYHSSPVYDPGIPGQARHSPFYRPQHTAFPIGGATAGIDYEYQEYQNPTQYSMPQHSTYSHR